MGVAQPASGGPAVLERETLLLRRPVVVSDVALSLLQKPPGGASFAVSHGDTSFFVYSTTVPRGTVYTPTYVAVYDESSNSVGESIPIAKSRPANDLHCTPGIVADGAGTLHVATGAHGWPMRYVRSTAPYSIASWTRQVNVISSGYRTRTTDKDGDGKQTYLSMICAPDGTVHIVSRQVRLGVDGHFATRSYVALVHTSLPPGQSTWSTPHLIVVPPQSGYSQFYQKLTVDQLGRLFVSCSYFSRRDPPATRTVPAVPPPYGPDLGGRRRDVALRRHRRLRRRRSPGRGAGQRRGPGAVTGRA